MHGTAKLPIGIEDFEEIRIERFYYVDMAGMVKELFDGLAIAGERELCEKYMGKFPVVSITLKGISAMDYERAKGMLRSAIGNGAKRFERRGGSPCPTRC